MTKSLLTYLPKLLFSHKVWVKNSTARFVCVHRIFWKRTIVIVFLPRKSLRIHTFTQNIKEENANGNNQKERHGRDLINKQTVLPNIVSWPICILFLIFYQPPSFLPAYGFMIYRLFPNSIFFQCANLFTFRGILFFHCTEIVRCSKQIYLSLFSLTATFTTFFLSVTVSSVLPQTNVIISRQKSQTLI